MSSASLIQPLKELDEAAQVSYCAVMCLVQFLEEEVDPVLIVLELEVVSAKVAELEELEQGGAALVRDCGSADAFGRRICFSMTAANAAFLGLQRVMMRSTMASKSAQARPKRSSRSRFSSLAPHWRRERLAPHPCRSRSRSAYSNYGARAAPKTGDPERPTCKQKQSLKVRGCGV